MMRFRTIIEFSLQGFNAEMAKLVYCEYDKVRTKIGLDGANYRGPLLLQMRNAGKNGVD